MSMDKEPPGVPPGPPPELSDPSSDEEDETQESQRAKTLRFSDDVNNSTTEDEEDQNMDADDQNSNTSKPTSLQQRMVALSGQNIDDFMKEMEAVHKNKETVGDKEVDGNKKDSSREDREVLVPPGTESNEQPTPVSNFFKYKSE